MGAINGDLRLTGKVGTGPARQGPRIPDKTCGQRAPMELLQAVRSPIKDDHIDAGQPGLLYHEQDVRLLRLMGLQHAFDHDVQQCGPVPISAQNKDV